jgi:hypothetical protein
MIDIYKTYETNNFGPLKIIKYTSRKNVDVEFIDTGFRATTRSDRILSGKIKDPLHPSIYEVGYLGEGKYCSTKGRGLTKTYTAWKAMLRRCYCPKALTVRPSYLNCTVDERWHNFQVFAEWYEENYKEGFQLDKDLLQCDVANKVYSPETCIFVSHADNTVEAHAKHYTMTSPEGKVINIYNMRGFCRDNKLPNSKMSEVHRGKIEQYKGWTKTKD